MRFQSVHHAARNPSAEVVYRPKEYSFDTLPAELRRGFASVLVDDLNLEVDEGGRVVSVWGMCPHTRWVEATLAPPSAEPGDLFVLPDHPFVRGISLEVNPQRYRPTYVDRRLGWVKVSIQDLSASAVEVLPGMIVEVSDGGKLCSLWLKPTQGLESP